MAEKLRARATRRGGRGPRRAAVLTAVLAVVASYGVTSTGSSAVADVVVGSSFQIDDDANLVVDGGAGTIDWLAGGTGTALRSGVIVRADEPSGSSDDSFTQGTKEDDTTPTIEDGSIPPSKSDLKSFGLYLEKYALANYVNVFWSRVQDPTGTTNIDFEFNQSAGRFNNPADGPQIIPVRTAGDILITYDLTNGGTKATISRRTWSGSEWGPETQFNDTQALGTINSSAIPANQAGGLGPFDPRTFGEASINLAALVPDQTQCITYGSVYVKSRSSASFPSELKDFIAPEPVTISNCGSVRIHKTDDQGAALSGAGFTLYVDAVPTGGTRGAADTVVAGSCTTNASGDCTIADVKKGEYWLVETTVPPGHDPAPDQHVSITTGDQVVSLNLVDPIQVGTIQVTKIGVPPDGTDFNFLLDSTAFQLDDDTNGTLPNTRSFVVPVGAHSLSEVDVPSGWALTGLSCTDPTANTTTSVANRMATINLAKDETVSCTFTNSYAAQTVPLSTQVVDAGTGWNDVATLTGDGTHAVTGTVAFYACSGQATPTGCPAGGTKVGGDAAVTHSSGATYTATTTTTLAPAIPGWTCFRAEYASSSPYYQNASHTNSTTECFLTRNEALTVSTTATPAFGRAYSWTIDKGVNTTRQEIPTGTSATFGYTVTVGHTHSDSTWTVSGTTTVSNPNDVAFTGVDLTQAVTNGGVCTVTNGEDVTVPANGSVQRAYTCAYAAAPSPGTGTSTATATWDATAHFTESSSANGSTAVDFGAVQPSTTDESVAVTDSVVGALGTVNALTDPNPTVISYSVTVPGVTGTCTTYPNTAAFLANDTAASGSSSRSVEVCVGADLTAVPTAAGTIDRSFAWTIDKSADTVLLTLPNGQDGTFAYTVTVRPAGITESAPVLAGSVLVTNPNDWEDVTADVAVSSDLGGGVTCTVTGGEDAVVPKGGALALPFTCAFSGVPSLTGTVSTTVTWDAAAFATPTGSAAGQTPVELTVANEANRTITVVDDKTDPANPVTLGTATYDDGEATFTYTLTQTGAVATTEDPACVDYTNVAGIVETAQSDTQVVTLCHTFTGGGGAPVVNPPQGGGLPTTGDAVGLLVRTALGLLGAGLVLLLVSRRRRSA